MSERLTNGAGGSGGEGGASGGGGDVSERRDYLEGGLVDIGCDGCGVGVRAGKRSTMQTSVQWRGRACELIAAKAGGRPAALVPTCPKLRESLDRAIREGRLEVS